MSSLIDVYISWLKNSFEEHEADSWTEIVTPFIDRNNDHIQLYLRQFNNKVVVTDDGSTFANLEFAGFSRTDKRADLLATVFRGFNINWGGDSSIELTCSLDEFPTRFHDLLQTILSVDSFGYFSEQNVKSMFFEDVAAWLGRNEISFHANREFEGKSGINVNFPFFLPTQKKSQPAIIQLVNNPRQSFKPFIFEWLDTESSRGNTSAFTIINDSAIQPPKRTLNAFDNYGVTVVPWSEKDLLLEKIAI